MRSGHRTRAAFAARVPGAPPWWLVAVAVALLVAVTLDVANHGVMTHVDSSISNWVKHRRIRSGTLPAHLLRALTFFGQRGPVLVVAVPVVAYLAWRARSVEPILRLALALIALTVAVYALKGTITRPAPSYEPGKANPAESYPSGHLANTLVTWGTVYWSAVRAPVAPVVTRVLAIVRDIAPFAVFIGMTLLNYHWFSDFLGGACVGVILLPLVLHPVWSSLSGRVDRRLRPLGITA